MYKFGSRPPRSIDSYGVAGLLGDEARVFYESVFNTHSLGRISDLLSARIRKTGMDELKFRALILFAAFEAYRGQISQGSKILKFIGRRDPADLLDPLVIEVGIDGEKIAIGVSFNLRNDVLFDSSGVSKRIEDRKPSTAFETLLLQLYDQSDRMILRHQAEARRVELISLLAIPGKMVKEELEEKPPLEVITLFKETLQEAPKPSTYEALGDVDYTSLLKDESRLREGRPVPKGEALARASNAGELDSKTKVSSRNAKDSSKTNVEGGEADDDQVVKVGGKAKKGGRDLSVKFKGEEQEEAAKNIHFSGAAEEEEEDGEVSFGTSARKAGKRFRSFLKRLTSGTEEDEVVEGAEQPGDPYYRVKHKRDPQGSDLIRISGGGAHSEVEEVPLVFEAGPAEDPTVVPANSRRAAQKAEAEKAEAEDGEIASTESKDAETQEGESKEVANPEKETQALVKELQASSSEGLTTVLEEAADIKKEMSSDRAKRWMDGLMGELVAERAKLQELTKRINLSVRQKELEFKNKEQSLQEDLRRKDDVIIQKNNALNRTKEQLAQLTKNLERIRMESESKQDDAHFKQKYSITQKMVSLAKEENAQLSKKIDQLRGQLQSAQLKDKGGITKDEFGNLQTKYDRLNRQADELKRLNQQLLAKVNDQKDNPKKAAGSATVSDDLKRRLEAAMKLAMVSKKENEKYQKRVLDMQDEQNRLRAELDRAQDLLKTTASLKPRRGSGGGSPPPGGGGPVGPGGKAA